MRSPVDANPDPRDVARFNLALVDPLRLKLDSLSGGSRGIPLFDALNGFGSAEDYAAIERAVDAVPDNLRVMLDFTPFERIGKVQRVREALESMRARRPLTLLFVAGGAESTLKEAGALNKPTEWATFDEYGVLFRPAYSKNRLGQSTAAVFRQNKTLIGLHRKFAASRLFELIHECTEYPASLPHAQRASVDGIDNFIRLDNGMLCSCYLNTKRLFHDPRRLFDVAFEVIRTFFSSFQRRGAPATPCDVIVAPTNNALVLGSAVHVLTGIPLCVIDRMGPVPSRHVAVTSASMNLYGKRVCLLTEVSSTGSEIDRSVQFLEYTGARLEKVYCCYGWSVGQPHLVDSTAFTILCQPKAALNYVYRSSP